MAAPYFCNGLIDCYIRKGGIFFGYLTFAGTTRPVTEKDIACADYICKIITIALNKDDLLRTRQDMYETLLRDLIEDNIRDHLALTLRLNSIRRSFKGNLHIVAIARTDTANPARFARSIQDFLRGYWENSLSLEYQGKIILLTEGSRRKTSGRSSYSLSQYLKANNLRAGFSNAYSNLSNTRRYYEQSIRALELGPEYYPEETITEYFHISLFDLLQKNTQAEQLREYCHPEILRLSNSNEPGDHELLHTLYVYLFCLCDSKKAAEELNIHRNSLYYRLEKLKSLFGSDLENGSVVCQLMLSFKIMEFFSKIENDKAHLPFLGSL